MILYRGVRSELDNAGQLFSDKNDAMTYAH